MYYCEALDKNVCLCKIKQKQSFGVAFVDSETGLYLFPITVPLYTTSRCYSYIDCVKFPRLVSWLCDNSLITKTFCFVYKDKKVYEKVKFVKEKVL